MEINEGRVQHLLEYNTLLDNTNRSKILNLVQGIQVLIDTGLYLLKEGNLEKVRESNYPTYKVWKEYLNKYLNKKGE